MKNLFFLSLIILLGTACKKDPIDFTLTGTISNSTLGGKLDGATITISQVPISGGTSKQLGSAVVGSDGKYSFTFLRDKVEKYVVTITKDNYFSIQEDIPFSAFSPEKDLVKDYTTTAKAWVKLHFVNQDPLDTDELTFRKQQGKVGCPECCTTEDHVLIGYVDTTIICPNDGNTTYSFFYTVAGSTNQGIESIVTPAFQTVTITKTY